MLLCRGMGLASARDCVKDRAGADGWGRLVSRLPPRSVARVWAGQIFPGGWYDARILDEFLDAVVAEKTPGVGEAIGARVARTDIEHNLPALGFDDPGAWLAQSQRVWSEYWSKGELVVVERKKTSIRLALENPGLHPLICGAVILGWGTAAVERAGRKVARNEHTHCTRRGDKRCEYVIEWA